MNRDSKGRFTSFVRSVKNFFKALFKIVFYTALLAAIIWGIVKYNSSKTVDTSTTQESVIDADQAKIEEIKNRDNFKKQADNKAKQILLKEQIQERKDKISDLEKEITTINGQLETARDEELSLQ